MEYYTYYCEYMGTRNGANVDALSMNEAKARFVARYGGSVGYVRASRRGPEVPTLSAVFMPLADMSFPATAEGGAK